MIFRSRSRSRFRFPPNIYQYVNVTEMAFVPFHIYLRALVFSSLNQYAHVLLKYEFGYLLECILREYRDT